MKKAGSAQAPPAFLLLRLFAAVAIADEFLSGAVPGLAILLRRRRLRWRYWCRNRLASNLCYYRKGVRPKQCQKH
jgi:hypothetical protein